MNTVRRTETEPTGTNTTREPSTRTSTVEQLEAVKTSHAVHRTDQMGENLCVHVLSGRGPDSYDLLINRNTKSICMLSPKIYHTIIAQSIG